ncbi:hypothetical protein [Aquibacillus saliphilus]|uniref:hypothetical protein n=1 Tax=Aquibacillus saliphilus TaxID=1909422 RepID=UPI001CF04993|nr:hypothetical protein [Aquibacillus saliphilus]
MKKLFCLIILLFTLLLSGCGSDAPGDYSFSLIEEKNGIEVTLDHVEEHANNHYAVTAIHYLITNNTEQNVTINIDFNNEEIDDTESSNYLQDGKGNYYSVMSTGATLLDDKEKDIEETDTDSKPIDSHFIEIPSKTEELQANIDYQVIGLDSFETQVSVAFPNGENVPFIFSGELNEQNLIEE